MVHNKEIYITASIGISLFPIDGYDIETLVKNADTAMYKAKEQGRNNYQFYHPTFNADAAEKLSMEGNLRKAMKLDEFLLHYQPQIDLGTERIIGAEALVRWQNKDRGLMGPKQFISLAEETGLIVPIGEFVLRTACAQNKAWQEAGFPPIQVSVNVSMNQFRQKNFVKQLTNILEETGLKPNSLELELTESIIMHNPDFTISILKDLKSLGIGVSIDDFGTGYSSLNYLKVLPLSKVKLDQSFIRGITTDPNDNAICRAIIMMAHSLNLKVIAEGVENVEQLELLRSLNCDEAQGFLFCRPLPAEDFMERVFS
jgi:EAL domain-containing protein (putative c-di-GMP-specific phosphodiesterase class I)